MLGGYRNPNDCACLKDLCLLALPRASKKREAQTRTYISYIVLCDGRYLGCIFYADAGVPKDAAGFGVSKFHEWQGRKGPQ